MRDHHHRPPRPLREPLAPRVRRGPPPPLSVDNALFLDIDGTLLDIAPTPDSVRVGPRLAALLPAVSALLGGAVALVTGRSIRDTDRMFGELVLPMAGQHGCERRDAEGTLHLHAANAATTQPTYRRTSRSPLSNPRHLTRLDG